MGQKESKKSQLPSTKHEKQVPDDWYRVQKEHTEAMLKIQLFVRKKNEPFDKCAARLMALIDITNRSFPSFGRAQRKQAIVREIMLQALSQEDKNTFLLWEAQQSYHSSTEKMHNFLQNCDNIERKISPRVI